MPRRISEQTARVLMLFLAAPARQRFGREIIAETGIKSGSLYPILHRLERQQMLVSAWEDLDVAAAAGRRPRLLYRLVAPGRAEALLREWEASRQPAADRIRSEGASA